MCDWPFILWGLTRFLTHGLKLKSLRCLSANGEVKAGKYPEFVAVQNKSQLWQHSGWVLSGRFGRDAGEIYRHYSIPGLFMISLDIAGFCCCCWAGFLASGREILSGLLSFLGVGVSCCGLLKEQFSGVWSSWAKSQKTGGGFSVFPFLSGGSCFFFFFFFFACGKMSAVQ